MLEPANVSSSDDNKSPYGEWMAFRWACKLDEDRVNYMWGEDVAWALRKWLMDEAWARIMSRN